MTQDYFSDKGKAPAFPEDEDNDGASSQPEAQPSDSSRPKYMTVGNGAESVFAAQLRTQLGDGIDSGYGGSSTGDDLEIALAAHDKQQRQHNAQAASVHQMWYNRHRSTLQRGIQQTVQLLRDLKEMNKSWPARYPSVQRAEATEPKERRLSARPSSRPGLTHTYSMLDDSELADSS